MMTSRSSEAIVDDLVARLAPVRRRRAWQDGALVIGFAALELILVITMTRPRPDLLVAMHGPMFWWKMASCLTLATTCGTAAVLALDPAGSPRRWWWGLAGVAAVAVAVLFGTSITMPEGLMARLQWRDGIACASLTLAYAVPMAILLTWLARRAAPTRPRLVAWAVGLSSAGWAAFAFAWTCWHDDPLYVVVWYGSAVLACTVLARTMLVRWIKW
ncbi:NrsF family protein [Polymorphobacter sp. PAMC 29334]|uniref:NrsF family protein n=1 Tax=Polymorphobacter sp. PAMC 29334 TaxID=2862331 RepID=UPI001D015359|nr:DUF1109 domain-containing protein [Polymorphobacter sp. PAMC 29334]